MGSDGFDLIDFLLLHFRDLDTYRYHDVGVPSRILAKGNHWHQNTKPAIFERMKERDIIGGYAYNEILPIGCGMFGEPAAKQTCGDLSAQIPIV